MKADHFTILTAHHFGNAFDSMLKLRHKVFVDRAGWVIPNLNHREADQFDHPLWTHYFTIRDDEGAVRACGRLVQTHRPYMLKELWPELAYGRELPTSPKIAEGSRTCVDPDLPRKEQTLHHAICTVAGIEWAWAHGIEQFVFVTYPSKVRALQQLGLDPTVYGPPIQMGEEEFLAGYYSTAPSSSQRIRDVFGIEGPVIDLHDHEEEVAA